MFYSITFSKYFSGKGGSPRCSAFCAVCITLILIVLPYGARAQVSEEWAKRFDNTFASQDDYANAVTFDGSGNVYVTGYSLGIGKSDYATVKYDAGGNELWVKHYDSGSGSNDRAYAVAVDGSGNVYVTGESEFSTTGYDYLTVKYDANGNELWVKRFDSGSGSNDYGFALAFDGSGNVYVTGTSYSSPTGYDYLTVKYDANGNEVWVKRFDSGTGGDDYSQALRVDGNGNVYVTGSSFGSNTGSDYVTVKYDAAGNQLWVQRYIDGNAISLELDGSGNVYVTGNSYSISNGDITGTDYVLVKYDANGNQLWAKRYDSGSGSYDNVSALAVDGGGNIYVTGRSWSPAVGDDYLTVKYDANGNEQWAKRYDSGGDYDYTRSVAVDGSGNVYVMGESSSPATAGDYVIVKYDANGNEQWAKRYDSGSGRYDYAFALAIDGSGNVYVTGSSQGLDGIDYLTVKYDDNGNQLWSKKQAFVGSGDDYTRAVAVDGKGDMYVTGSSFSISNGNTTGSDYVTVKYDAEGNQLWVQRYIDGNAADLAVDGSGNVYVTGSSFSSNMGSGYVTVKYDADGNELWIKRYDSGSGSNDNPVALAVDGRGNVYVTGYSQGISNGGVTVYDYATVKYDADGNQLWAKQYDSGSNDIAVALAVDGSGNVYVTGSNYSNTGSDYLTVKYDAGGNELWVQQYEGGKVIALAVDSSENVYVTGNSYSSTPGSDYVTVKYDTEGNQQWVKQYDGESGGDDYAVALAVDGSGNVYVTGSSYGNTGIDYATVKYDADGNQLWVKRYDNGSNDIAVALAVDGSGNVYVTGNSLGSTWYDYATVKYDTGGNQLWVKRYDSGSGDDAVALAVDGSGNVYVTGNSSGTTTGNDYVTIKYNQKLPNQAPVLATIGNKAVNEGTKLSFTVTASDDPNQTLTYSLAGMVPAGAGINAATGAFEWTPSEEQGPGEFALTVRVTDNGAGDLYSEQAFSITVVEVNQAPVLSAIADQTVNVGATLTLTASATDADLPANTLTYSLVGAPIGAAIDASTGAFSWTPTAAGVYAVTVQVTDGSLSDQKNFQVTVNAKAPQVTAFSPASGRVGTTVIISGSNLLNATRVAFNGTAASISANTATQITTTVPAGATTGLIRVTTAGGTATSSSAFTVTYPKPAISSFTPTSGPVGTTVTITGSGFAPAVTTVRFSNTTATQVTVQSATTLLAVVPSGASTGKVSVSTPGGTATSKFNFTVTVPVTPAPVISSFSPASGPVGTTVTITGSNFLGTTALQFNGIPAVFTVKSATQITATVPAGAKSGKITVVTPRGTATSQQRFTVTSTARLAAEKQPITDELTVVYYPNPFSQSFVLKVQGKGKEKMPFRIYNTFGQVVLKGEDLEVEQTMTIGTALMTGVYTLEVGSGNCAKRYKLVKAR